MKSRWITPALLGAVLLIGCGRTDAPPAEETEMPPAAAENTPGESVSPDGDNRAVTPPATESRPAPASPARPSRPAPPKVSESTPAERPRTDPAAESRAEPTPPRVEYRNLTVPAGTPLPLELLTPLSSETTTVETPVRARLKQAISVDGYPILPAGTEFTGSVTEVAQPGRVQGRARVTFSFTEAMVAGAREKVQTDPLTFEAQPTKGEDAAKIGAGAGIGAVIGGILGGGSGAAKGAAIGGAAGTGAVLATKGQNVEVAAGADIAASLSEPFVLRVRQ